MSIRRSLLWLLTTISLLSCQASARAVTVQSPNDVLFDGSAFLWVEAEDVAELGGDESTGFIVVDNVNPIKSTDAAVKGELDILPADTNASGGAALLDELGGGRHANTAKWELQFAIPSTYYLYVHASIYNSDGNTSYGNEDSFFLPPRFNANSSDDWIGFEGIDQDGNPMTGDSNVDGWMPVFNNKVVVSGGVGEVHNSTDEDFWDGYFHWMFADYAVDSNADGGYIDDYGLAIQYEVTEADLGQVQTFEISTREHYGVIDAFLFSTNDQLLTEYTQEQMDEFFLNRGGPPPGDFNGNGVLDAPDIDDLTAQSASQTEPLGYDLNGDSMVNGDDVKFWVKDLYGSWLGDANLDKEFNSTDLVDVLAAGTFEADVAAVWSTGDFNGDGRANSSDLVEALADGGYEAGPPATVASVPEPSGMMLSLLGLAALATRRRSRS